MFDLIRYTKSVPKTFFKDCSYITYIQGPCVSGNRHEKCKIKPIVNLRWSTTTSCPFARLRWVQISHMLIYIKSLYILMRRMLTKGFQVFVKSNVSNYSQLRCVVFFFSEIDHLTHANMAKENPSKFSNINSPFCFCQKILKLSTSQSTFLDKPSDTFGNGSLIKHKIQGYLISSV